MGGSGSDVGQPQWTVNAPGQCGQQQSSQSQTRGGDRAGGLASGPNSRPTQAGEGVIMSPQSELGSCLWETVRRGTWELVRVGGQAGQGHTQMLGHLPGVSLPHLSPSPPPKYRGFKRALPLLEGLALPMSLSPPRGSNGPIPRVLPSPEWQQQALSELPSPLAPGTAGNAQVSRQQGPGSSHAHHSASRRGQSYFRLALQGQQPWAREGGRSGWPCIQQGCAWAGRTPPAETGSSPRTPSCSLAHTAEALRDTCAGRTHTWSVAE